MNNKLSTHILDIYSGHPANNVKIELFKIQDNTKTLLKSTTTNSDGRVDSPLLKNEEIRSSEYELLFHIGDYFKNKNIKSDFINIASVRFCMQKNQSYHVPLLASPWAYSTYRGS